MHDREAKQIKDNGWRQGSVLPDSIVELLVQHESMQPLGNDQILVVISHDCDVTNSTFDREPSMELLTVKVLAPAEKEGSLAWGKNPRQYQLACKWRGQDCYCQFSIHDRITVSRKHLAAGAARQSNPLRLEQR